MRYFLRFVCGFCFTFSSWIWFNILMFIWPHPLPSFGPPENYSMHDTQIFIIGGAAFLGLMVGAVYALSEDS